MLNNPLKSWTLRFLFEQWGPMTLGSAIRYRNLVVRKSVARNRSRTLLALRMRRPIAGDIWLRREGSDKDNFREIVIDRVYDGVTDKIQDCRYVIDLGANIGLAARLFAARYPLCRILAVEPHPGNYKLLEKNLSELVGMGRCRTVRAAVWDRKARLAVAPPPEGEDCYYAMFVYETLEEGVQVVDALTMTELIEQSGFPVVDLLKVDIEGAEVSLFRGGLSWLTQIHTIAIEFHGDSRERIGFDAIMEHHGFQIDDSNPHTVLAIRRESSKLQTRTTKVVDAIHS
jgi:FkbM family methyltransferase